LNLDDLYRLLRTTHVQAQAVVDTVREPLLVLDRELTVLSASRSFYETFGVGRDDTLGRHLYELGNGQWDIPDLRHLLEAVIPRSAAVEGYEVEHDFPGLGRRAVLLHARRLSRPDNNSAALLLAVEDVTERRRGERERELRYGELRHRVKNLFAMVEALAHQTVVEGRTVEAYLLDFDGDLYGEHVGVEFVQRLRPMGTFAGVEELVTAMDRDVARTREVLAVPPTPSF